MSRTFRVGTAVAAFLAAFAFPFTGSGTAVAQQLLPDLTMMQPTDFHLELQSGGGKLLRFSTRIVNLGPGRFDVYGSEPDPADATRLTRVTQRLQLNGGWVEQLTPATMFFAGDGHDHWHVFGLQDFKLAFQATPNDRIATGAKNGFCFWDNVNLSNAPRFYTGATECHQQSNGTVPMGLSVSWGDMYPWNIAFQYVDMTSLPYGNYCLTLTADPRGEFVEANTANNTIQTSISVQPGGVTVLAPNCAAGSGARVVHVADLDRTAKGKGKSGKWDASVIVTVRDDAGIVVTGATVAGNWSGAISRSASGVTASNGTVTLTTGQISGGTSVTFTVTNVTGTGLTYAPAENTDPDTDSNGTAITIPHP
jgi:lysyl oxidase